jgi:hypothetical protein
VLAVLEAVHLLLAFPLFVCAVAVDPRWVEQCLREVHKELFINESESKVNGQIGSLATVGDYLEKIFQIPMWMLPIESRARATLVNSLLGPTAAPPARRAPAGQIGAASSDPAPATVEGSAFSTLVAKARETPDPLRISIEEAAFVEEIANLLSDRPRALKRFVNVYRLLKASLPDIERASFVTADIWSPHRICLSQLAMFTSHPRVAPLLVARLHQPNGDTDSDGAASVGAVPLLTLKKWFDALELPVQEELRTAIGLVPKREVLPLEAFRLWLPLTSRYLFHRAD